MFLPSRRQLIGSAVSLRFQTTDADVLSPMPPAGNTTELRGGRKARSLYERTGTSLVDDV